MPPTEKETLIKALSECQEFGCPKISETMDLVGRDKVLSEVKKKLNAHHFVDVYGPRGMGKTRLIQSVIEEIKLKYRTLLWLDCSSVEALQLCLSTVVPSVSQEMSSPKILNNEILPKFRLWVKDQARLGPFLVVLDGLTDQRTLKEVPDFSFGDTMYLLVTSTFQVTDLPSVKSIHGVKLEKLSNKDVSTALCKYCVEGQLTEDESVAAETIAESINGDPLLMTIVVVFIRRELKSMKIYSNELSETGGSSDQYATIFDRIACLSDLASVMNLLAFCDPSSIPLKMFEYGDFNPKDTRDDKKRTRKPSEKTFVSTILLNQLESYRLISWTENQTAVRIHTEIAKKLRARLNDEQKTRILGVLCDMLTTSFTSCRNNWEFCSSLYTHTLRCLEHMKDLGMFNADLLLQCGYMKSLLGGSEEAKTLLSECLNNKSVTEHQKVTAYRYLATVDRRLGNLLLASERVNEAKLVLESLEERVEKMVLESLEEREKQEEKLKEAEDKVKEVAAEVLMDSGSFGLALQLLNEVFVKKPPVYDSNPFRRSAFLSNVARAQLGLRNFDKAFYLYKQAQEILDKAQANDPRSQLYQAYGHVAKACDMREKMLASEVQCVDEFCNEVNKCVEVVRQLPSSHRYYAWGFRSLARLKLCKVEMLKKGKEKLDDPDIQRIKDVLMHAFECIRSCIECHINIASGLHIKVAKACIVAGNLCIEWLSIPTASEKRTACICAKEHFELAIEIMRPLAATGKFPYIKKEVKSAQDKLKLKRLNPEGYVEEFQRKDSPVRDSSMPWLEGTVRGHLTDSDTDTLLQQLLKLAVKMKSNAGNTSENSAE